MALDPPPQVVFVNPSTIPIHLYHSQLPALPGTEKACLLLARELSSQRPGGVHYVGNVEAGQWGGVLLHPLADLQRVLALTAPGPVVWVRAYGWEARSRHKHERTHVLWSGDAVEDLLALGYRDEIIGRVDHPDSLFAGYHRAVLVSDWQRRQWLQELATSPPLTRIYNLTDDPDVNATCNPAAVTTVVNTSHPRKSLGLFCQVARAVCAMHDGFRFVATSSPRLYDGDESEAVYVPIVQGKLANIGSFAQVRERYGDVVEFREPQRSDDLAWMLSRADVFLHPDTSVETGSMALIEAMKHGAVPVVSQVGALPELCGSQGLVVPGTPGERQFLVNVVNAVLRAKGHGIDEADVLARFGMDVIVSQWVQLL
nr:glycosyltransferase [uncultured Actinomyces sp.]